MGTVEVPVVQQVGEVLASRAVESCWAAVQKGAEQLILADCASAQCTVPWHFFWPPFHPSHLHPCSQTTTTGVAEGEAAVCAQVGWVAGKLIFVQLSAQPCALG